MFTSGDVSLSNIVIFHGCKSFKTRQILLWMTNGDISFYSEISMSLCDAEDGSFISYLN